MKAENLTQRQNRKFYKRKNAPKNKDYHKIPLNRDENLYKAEARDM